MSRVLAGHRAQEAIAAAALSDAEYEEVVRRLGRHPNRLELWMFGAMWSEHCGYKHSRPYLRLFGIVAAPQGPGPQGGGSPTGAWGGPRVLQGPGGNAGVVEIAPGIAVALKIESHNHPSAVDPFHGAATGVGGIVRDVLAMGARPVALLDSLRFGPLDDVRTRRLRDGVVAGIAHYGNAIGVPTVGGETHCDPAYTENPLVNVACVGVLPTHRLQRSAAAGPGNAVVYVGARTGRDGIGGAAFASDELGAQAAQDDRAAVQIGDPFAGKLLIEATLEALETGAVVALQDMGAAGLTCAAAEMAARGAVGMTIWVDRVPRREAGMTPEEVMLSESQERMLLVVQRSRSEEVAAIYRRWGLVAETIGEVSAEPVLRVYDRDELVAEIPPTALADAPTYAVPEREPQVRRRLREADLDALPPSDPGEALTALLRSPGIASKRTVYTQYDHMVQINTVVGPGSDAAVLRIKEAPPLGVGISVDGCGRVAHLDPWAGGARAVCEAALNVACAGARPVAVTDGLNFGSPRRPEVAWEMHGVVRGIADACGALGLPVVSGNVSLYNESGEKPIHPTPIVAVLGVLADVAKAVPTGFQAPGDWIVLVGSHAVCLGASEYLRVVHGRLAGAPQRPDLELHARLVNLLVDCAQAGLLRSAHDVSDGGLAVALAEACMHGGVGAVCALADEGRRADDVLFSEGPSRVLVSVAPDRYKAFCECCAAHGVPIRSIGWTGGDRLRIEAPGAVVDLTVGDLRAAWEPSS
ncbi:MAG: phosphoribosylformylglycinamidine synthase subunit PurL [Armatimonadota bacterium]|nr:phosphoribosylformylglycinamidine synthase subunit PurL [Armatimonadota bacterium]MDR5697836.1 phosphoribosylformylglycinamidine synthase subunit PurL [Armatimonadota bacterium]